MSQTNLCPTPRLRFFDSNGEPLSGGKLYTFLAGTSTPEPTYTDSTGSFANTNPVILDSQGYCDVWLLMTPYKLALHDANDVPLWSVDNVVSFTLAQQFKLLNISPYTYPTKFNITNGQSATPLSGESFDGLTYSSVRYEFEIIQGSAFSNGVFYLQYQAGTWRIIMADVSDAGIAYGVSFSVTQAGSVGQLKAAESGLGNATVQFKKSTFLQSP